MNPSGSFGVDGLSSKATGINSAILDKVNLISPILCIFLYKTGDEVLAERLPDENGRASEAAMRINAREDLCILFPISYDL